MTPLTVKLYTPHDEGCSVPGWSVVYGNHGMASGICLDCEATISFPNTEASRIEQLALDRAIAEALEEQP